MKKGSIIALVLALLVSAPMISNADDSSSGCGLGWQVTRKNSLLSSWIRASTNYTFSNTIGMTSGTSGCARHDIVQEDSKAIHYAEANYHRLMVEMSQGSGEFLTGFADVLGCDLEGSARFAKTAQSHYGDLYTTDGTPSQLLQQTRILVSTTPELALHCGASQSIARR